LVNKRKGENSKKIAAEIGRAEGIGERTVRLWASEIERRGNALRKPGSGRPEKYNKAVINKIVELNDMYGNQASSRDIAEVLKDEFGFGSFQREVFFAKVFCVLTFFCSFV
jgi:transposase